jgi:hypothetical protein
MEKWSSETALLFGVNPVALVVATVAAFVASTIRYIVFGKQRAKLLGRDPGTVGRPPPWKVLAELARNVIIAYAVTRLVMIPGAVAGLGTVGLAISLWVGFPVMILIGSVMWENVPWKLAAIHAGDWLVKLALILGVVSALG